MGIDDITSSTELICCSSCDAIKPAVAFAWRSRERGQRLRQCRLCRSVYHREHYVANRSRYIDKAAKRRRAITAERMTLLVRFFQGHPCVICGETNPAVLEFHHLGNKSFNLADGFRDRQWIEVVAEIEKCEVRCGNCRKLDTGLRRNWYRALILADPQTSVEESDDGVASCDQTTN